MKKDLTCGIFEKISYIFTSDAYYFNFLRKFIFIYHAYKEISILVVNVNPQNQDDIDLCKYSLKRNENMFLYVLYKSFCFVSL